MVISNGMVLGIPWPQVPPRGALVLAADPAFNSPESGRSPFLRETLDALLRTIAVRDPYTGQHSARVTAIALKFAGFLGLSATEVRFLKNAVYLHDIGKIGISDAILLKPGPLTPEERQIINTHPMIGEKIVEPLGLASPEKEIILLHHERWDGKGYPYGLSGEDIPFLCRLTSLADVYDALTTDRPYRRRFTPNEAIQEIENQAGRQFDPILTGKFVGFLAATGSGSPFG